MRIAIPVFPGVEELDVIAPFEVFGLARQLGAAVEVELVKLGAEPTIRAFHGLVMAEIPAPSGIYDIVVVPGGAWLAGGETGVRRAVTEGILPRWLAEQHAGGALMASVCTGAFLLEAAGLLNDRVAATHHSARADLRSRGVEVSEDRVVDAGDVISAGGITSGLDLALAILARTFGPELAARVADVLEYPAAPRS